MRKSKLFLLTLLSCMVVFLTACSSRVTVKFDTDGGSSINDQTILKGGYATQPQDPTKASNYFDYWELDGKEYNFNDTVSKNITLKAIWSSEDVSVQRFTVNFEAGVDSVTLPAVTVTADELLTEPSVSKEGYTLFGWQIKNTTNYFNFNNKVTSNMTLVAVWEKIPDVDTSTYDLFISEVYENDKTSADRYVEIYNPTNSKISLDGYSLKFAYKGNELDNETASKEKRIDLDGLSINGKSCLVIFPEKATDYIKSFSVTSNVLYNDNILHDADDRYGLYKDGTIIDLVEQEATDFSAKDSRMERNYGVFGSTTFNSTEWTVTSSANYAGLDTCGIHKLFETDLDPIIHTVTFNSDGGSNITSKSVLTNSVITVTPPTRTGYDFVGWLVNGVPYDISTPITSDITITAKWEELSLDNVELDVFFSEIYESDAGSAEKYVEIFNPTEYDINLDGYSISMAYNNALPTIDKYNTDLSGLIIKPYSTIVIYDSTMSKANIEAIQGDKIASENIKHDGNDNYVIFKDGEIIDMLGYLDSIDYHKNLSLRRNPGMYGTVSFNENEWTSYVANVDGGMSDAGSHYFRELPTYTITFISDGTSVPSQTVVTGNTIVLPTAPTKQGFKFVCWEVNEVPFDEATLIKSDYTLVATWEVFNGDMYNVSFDTGESNTVINPQNVYSGDLVLRPLNPFYDGYNLIGWTLNDVPFDFDTTIIDSNITLVAVWEAKVFFTVTFNTDGSEVDPVVVERDYTVSAATTEKFGYNFVEWRLDGVKYNFDTPITQDITLDAIWTQLTYSPETFRVDSITAFNNIVGGLEPGDTVIFEDGTYDASSISSVKASGTDFGLITIQANTTGGVVFTGTVSWEISGDYVVLSGFTFNNGTAKSGSYVITILGSHVRVTNVEIDAFDTATNKSGYIVVKNAAKYAEIDNCSFINKNSPGVLLLIDKYSDEAMYTHVHHNYFYNYTNPDPVTWTNELETMRIGWSGHSQTPCYSVVEYNIFENISSETELVSVKSGFNIVRNNLILNCSAAITVRHGNTCLVENNVILNDDIEDGNGIRLFDKYHVIRNNYISGIADLNSSFNAALVLHNGGNEIGTDNGSLNSQWTTNNVLVQNNSFVNNDINIALGDEKYSKVPGYITFDSNFVLSEVASAIRQYPTDIAKNVTYINEHYYALSLGLVSSDTPSGINFFTDLTAANVGEVNGLIHYAAAGAQGLSIMDYSEVGPKTTISTAVSMTAQDYLNYFNDWPFPLEN